MSAHVLITGGAGFLGRAILRRIAKGDLDWEPTIYSRDETKQDECRRKYPNARYILGDVRDIDRLTATMVGHDFVIHAAALKYIPEAELNAAECFSVNIDGARNVVHAALQAGVKRVVGISTDKAVQPVNAYGCSKMAMERLFAESSRSGTVFACVRYGNVVGSTGSVIPMFQRQAAEEGRVKVTDPKMTRFWMGVDAAIDLVLIALVAQPGAVVVPLVTAMELGQVAAASVGANEDTPVYPIEIIGERPGEKKHECLLHYEESVRVVKHVLHFELLPPGQRVEGLEPHTIASHNPHFWMTIEEMRKLIEDAKGV